MRSYLKKQNKTDRIETITKQVTDEIEQHQMIREGDLVLAGVSGGADSVCLLLLLEKIQKIKPFRLAAVHVEHGIRGEESRRDAAFVRELCEKKGITCYVVEADVPSVAKQERLTLEEAARKVRYEAFEKIADEIGADRIAVAHHQKDQAETMLLNLIRGSGVRGLGGILPVRGRIIRPLLNLNREDIELCLQELGQTYCTDQTNLETEYTRNKIRLQVMPLLNEMNPAAVSHMAQCAGRMQMVEDYLQKQTDLAAECCLSWDGKETVLDISAWDSFDLLIQEYLLRRCVMQVLEGEGLKDYTALHIEKMMQLTKKADGKQLNFPHGLLVSKIEGKLYFVGTKEVSLDDEICRKNKNDRFDDSCMIQVPCQADGIYSFGEKRFRIKFLQRDTDPDDQIPSEFEENKYTKWLAYDTIKDGICLRNRKPGDYLQIHADGGRKKLKDYLIDQKIPRSKRDDLILVTQGSHVLWIVGMRISAGARITEETNTMIRIDMLEEE